MLKGPETSFNYKIFLLLIIGLLITLLIDTSFVKLYDLVYKDFVPNQTKGHAEMEKEIQKTVTRIIQSQADMDVETKVGIDLDENELKRYLDIVIKEVKKDNR